MSETTIADETDTIVEDPESSSTPIELITCNRCGTLTTWNPYCPSCGAYLEFSGTPAWHPDEQLSTIPAPAPAATETGTTDTDAATTDSEASETATDSSAADGSGDEDPSAADPDSPEHRDSQVRHLLTGLFHRAESDLDSAEHDLEHEGDKAKSDLEGDLHPTRHGVKPWWASWGDAPVNPGESDEIPAAKVSASSGIQATPDTGASVVFASRRVVPAPAIAEPSAELPGLPMDETRKTRAMGNEELDTDGETCTRCELKNPAGRQYCDWCGTPLPGVMLGPESDAYNPYGLKSSGTAEVSTAPRRSYALKFTLFIALLATLLWVGWYFFLGPKSEQTITVIKIAAQDFTEWLAPSIGDTTTITNVTASSSLVGTSPLALKSLSSRDFWASAPMTLYGAGSKVTFTFDKPYEIDRIAIYPGIQNQTFDVNALGTPKTLTIDVGNGKLTQAHVAYIAASNDYEQILSIPTVLTDKVTITFDEVYPPRYPDPAGNNIGEVAVSSFAFLQVPSATTVNPLATASPSASGSASPSGTSSASPSPSSSNSTTASATPTASASPSPTSSKKK